MNRSDLESLHVRAYSDASFATCSDSKSQRGYIILLCDKNNSSILHFTSYKSRKIVRSVLGSETYAFADAYDFADCAKTDLERIHGRDIPIIIFTYFNTVRTEGSMRARYVRMEIYSTATRESGATAACFHFFSPVGRRMVYFEYKYTSWMSYRNRNRSL